MQTSNTSNKQANELYPHQKEAINKIKANFNLNINTLCAYDVGTGKTRIACEIIKDLLDKGEINSSYVLIICPSTTVRDTIWKETLSMYKIESEALNSSELAMHKNQTSHKFTYRKKSVFTITYNLLYAKDKYSNLENIEYFQQNPPAFIIYDEMHRLSNNAISKKKISTQKYFTEPIDKKTTLTINKLDSKRKLGLTATPVVNRKLELSTLCRLLNNDIPTGYENFYINHFYIKYTTSGIIGKTSLLFYEPTSTEKENIEIQLSQTAINSNYIFPKRIISSKVVNKFKTKENILRQLIENIPADDKIIIFDSFIANLFYIKSFSWIKSYHPTLLYGSRLSHKEKIKRYNDFENNKNSKILLTIKQLASEGWNLQNANHLIICDLSWNPKEIIQTLGRINRSNQQKTIYSYILGEYNSIPEDTPNTISWQQLITDYSELNKKLADIDKKKNELCMENINNNDSINQKLLELENEKKTIKAKTITSSNFLPPTKYFMTPLMKKSLLLEEFDFKNIETTIYFLNNNIENQISTILKANDLEISSQVNLNFKTKNNINVTIDRLLKYFPDKIIKGRASVTFKYTTYDNPYEIKEKIKEKIISIKEFIGKKFTPNKVYNNIDEIISLLNFINDYFLHLDLYFKILDVYHKTIFHNDYNFNPILKNKLFNYFDNLSINEFPLKSSPDYAQYIFLKELYNKVNSNIYLSSFIGSEIYPSTGIHDFTINKMKELEEYLELPYDYLNKTDTTIIRLNITLLVKKLDYFNSLLNKVLISSKTND